MCEPMNPAPPVTRISAARQATVPPVPDVILPVLNEREALPWVLERMPDGYAPLVVDNGSTDGSGELAASLGARVVRRADARVRRRVLRRADRGRRATSCASWTATRPSIRASCRRVADPVRDGTRRPDARRAPARPRAARGRCTPGRRTRCSRSSCGGARKVPLRDLGPMRAARREALLDLGIRTAASAGRWRWCCAPPAAGWTIREVGVAYHPREGRSKVTGTVRGTVRAVQDMTRVLR